MYVPLPLPSSSASSSDASKTLMVSVGGGDGFEPQRLRFSTSVGERVRSGRRGEEVDHEDELRSPSALASRRTRRVAIMRGT